MSRNLWPPRALAVVVCAAILAVSAPDALGQETNAAELYREALNKVPIGDEAVKAIKNADECPLADARKVVEEGRPALELVSRAAGSAKVDWGVDFSGKGAPPDLSFLDNTRGLSGLASLQARVRFADGKVREAANGLFEAMVMGRRIQQMPTLLTRMLGTTVEMSAFHQLAEYLPRLDEELAGSLARQFASLPAPPALREVRAVEDRQAGEPAAAGDLQKQAAFDDWTAANRAMFQAALAHRVGGESALQQVKDPFGQGPFTVRKHAGGYELVSKFAYRGKPTTLFVGKPDRRE